MDEAKGALLYFNKKSSVHDKKGVIRPLVLY
jgi:hypothetical protein